MQQLNKTTKKSAKKTAETRKFREIIRRIELGLDLGNRYSTNSCCGITLAQCHLLLEIGSNQGSSINSIAQQTGLDKSTLSRTVDALIKGGFISRRESSADRRRLELYLTDNGMKKIRHINTVCDDFYGIVLDKLKDSGLKNVFDAIKIFADVLVECGQEKKGGQYNECKDNG